MIISPLHTGPRVLRKSMTNGLLKRSDITERAGVPDDVLTFWLRRNLIRPVAGARGKGNHLRFERHQAAIAAILNVARTAGLNVVALSAISDTVQGAFAVWRQANRPAEDVVAVLEELEAAGATKGNAETLRRRYDLDLIEGRPDRAAKTLDLVERYEATGYIDEIVAAAARIANADPRHLWIVQQVLDLEGLLIIYRLSIEEDWIVEARGGIDERSMPGAYCLVINLTRVLPSKNQEVAQ